MIVILLQEAGVGLTSLPTPRAAKKSFDDATAKFFDCTAHDVGDSIYLYFTLATRYGIVAGGIETVLVQDQFDGDQRGTLIDPFGHV
jgi:uncharacterized glyoxalase superfamily protein PhnB